MKHLLVFAVLWTAISSTHALFSQVISPEQSRQSQFLWEQHQVDFQGVNRDSIAHVFQRASHSLQATSLALHHRTSPLPDEVTTFGPDTSSIATNLLASRNYLHSGINRIVIPIELVPLDWLHGEWSLLLDGEVIPIIPNEILDVFISEGTNLTALGLRVAYAEQQWEQQILFPVFPLENCPEPDLPPWPAFSDNDPWWIGCFEGSQPVGGQAIFKLSDDGIFDKPIILSEGFDPGIGGNYASYGYGDMNWEVLWNCNGQHETMANMPDFINELNAEGFDLVYLDFDDGTRPVIHQSALLQHLIELCKTYREGQEPIVLIGASMGGLIARHALRKMELEQTDHCTRLFVAIDCPFSGAHLPLALQEAVSFLSPITVDAWDLNQALQSPAARELLFSTPNGSPSEFLALHDLLAEWGMPQVPKCASISNGRPSVPFPQTDSPLLHACASFLGWAYVNFWLYPEPGDPQYSTSDATQWAIFDAHLINTDWQWGEDLILDGEAHCSPTFPGWGSIPGSSSEHLSSLRNALELAGIEATTYQDQSMYIPVLSAMDLPLSMDGLQELDLIPFDFYSFQPEERPIALHCDITDHTEKLLDWIVASNPIEISSDLPVDLHLGWLNPHQYWLGSAAFNSTSTLSIGTEIGNGAGGYPTFQASSAPCVDTIELLSGSTMLIGDSLGGGTGIFHLKSGTELNLHHESSIHIGPNSMLVIHEGSTINLHGGILHVHPGGSISIQSEGQLRIEESSSIILDGPEAILELAGDLIVVDEKQLHISFPSNSVHGQIHIKGSEGYAYIGTQSTLLFEGSTQGLCGLHFDSDAALAIHGPGLAKFENLSTILEDGAWWQINSPTQFSFMQINGWGTSTNVQVFNRLNWNHGGIENLNFTHEHATSASLKLMNLDIESCNLSSLNSGIHLDHCTWTSSAAEVNNPMIHSWISDNQFHGGIQGKAQLTIPNGPHPLRIENCAFHDHWTGVRLKTHEAFLGCNVFEHMQTGIQIDSLGSAFISPPYGRNRFDNNERHMAFNNGLWTDLIQGGNMFGAASHQIMEGVVSLETPGNNGVVQVAVNGNSWPNCTNGVVCDISNTNLTSNLDDSYIDLKDAHPFSLTCGNSGDSNDLDSDMDGRKNFGEEQTIDEWVIYPNPARTEISLFWPSTYTIDEKIDLTIMDSQGQIIYSKLITLPPTGKITLDLIDTSPGWHAVQIRRQGANVEVFPFLVIAP
jgi:hypothetical protein